MARFKWWKTRNLPISGVIWAISPPEPLQVAAALAHAELEAELKLQEEKEKDPKSESSSHGDPTINKTGVVAIQATT